MGALCRFSSWQTEEWQVGSLSEATSYSGLNRVASTVWGMHTFGDAVWGGLGDPALLEGVYHRGKGAL